MNAAASLLLDVLVCGVCVLQLLLCPYTKVEESFNLQASHDLLYLGPRLHEYDHWQFPGVVPRTFLGPIAVSALSFPFVAVANALGATKFTSQYIVRAVLGVLVCVSFAAFRRAAQTKLGPVVGVFLSLITVCQFHFLFYASRPLPNTFALVLALLSLRFWLLQQHGCFIVSSGAAIVLFRSELSLLLGPILLMELFNKRLTFWRALPLILPAGAILLGLTCAVDTVFWGKFVWPEGAVLWFNTIQNRSHLWGTQPLWWYFTSALPRAMLLPFFSVPWALYRDRRTVTLAVPAFTFVALYSLLPHKELRFIIYALPLFNLIAACGYSNIWLNRRKLPLFLPVGVASSLLLSFTVSLCFLHVSQHNYPGGLAFARLHKLADHSRPVSVHIGVEAAMTGVSRFGELSDSWRYSKEEGLEHGSEETLAFDYLLVSAEEWFHYNDTHSVVAKGEGFASLSVSYKELPPLRMVLQDKILVLKKRE